MNFHKLAQEIRQNIYDQAVFDEALKAWRFKDKNNYIRLYDEKPNPKNFFKFRYEHRKVMEDDLKRQLALNEIIHHLDKDRSNNARENLALVIDHLAHIREHHPEWRVRKQPSGKEVVQADLVPVQNSETSSETSTNSASTSHKQAMAKTAGKVKEYLLALQERSKPGFVPKGLEDLDSTVNSGMSWNGWRSKTADEKDEPSFGNITEKQKDEIRNFVVNTKDIDDSKVHAFMDKLKVNKHVGETVIYRFLQELANIVESREAKAKM